METSNPVLSGLIRKRQEVAAELDAAQSRLRQLILDIDALDATIRLFQPDIDLAVVKVRPMPRRYEANRGDTSRLILSLLREAGEGLSHREVTRQSCRRVGWTYRTGPLCRRCGTGLGPACAGCVGVGV